ncbi:rhomboid family intramembrane serine protease [Sphingomonas sp.]
MFARAPATLGIAIVTALASIILFVSGWGMYAAIAGGFIPARFGGELPFLDETGLMPAWATPFTATLIHANVIHLGFNLVMLLFTGAATERAIGSRGVVLLYLVGAIAAVLAHWLIDPMSAIPLIGASGAVSALVGAYSLLYGRMRAKAMGPLSPRAVQVLWLLAAWTGINLLVGVMSAGSSMPIAAAAHIGGFVAGLALARPLVRWHWQRA